MGDISIIIDGVTPAEIQISGVVPEIDYSGIVFFTSSAEVEVSGIPATSISASSVELILENPAEIELSGSDSFGYGAEVPATSAEIDVEGSIIEVALEVASAAAEINLSGVPPTSISASGVELVSPAAEINIDGIAPTLAVYETYSILFASAEINLTGIAPTLTVELFVTPAAINVSGIAALGVGDIRSATITATFPSFEASLYGGANLIPVLPSLSMQGSGTAGHAGELSFSFPKLSCEIHTGGQATVEFPGMSLEMTAVSTVVAEISLQFPVLGFSGVAARASEGDIDITLPMLQAAMEMTVGIVGSISGRLPRFSMGIVALPGGTGDLKGTFRIMSFSAEGGPSGPGEISAEMPMLEMTLTSGAIESDVLRYNWERVT